MSAAEIRQSRQPRRCRSASGRHRCEGGSGVVPYQLSLSRFKSSNVVYPGNCDPRRPGASWDRRPQSVGKVVCGAEPGCGDRECRENRGDDQSARCCRGRCRLDMGFQALRGQCAALGGVTGLSFRRCGSAKRGAIGQTPRAGCSQRRLIL